MVIKKISGFEKPLLEERINLVVIPHGVNFYHILGVDRTASKGKISKAFNELSLKVHPDKNGGDRTKKDKVNNVIIRTTRRNNKRSRRFGSFLAKKDWDCRSN